MDWPILLAVHHLLLRLEGRKWAVKAGRTGVHHQAILTMSSATILTSSAWTSSAIVALAAS
jgi:hypothetical protein